MKGISSNRHGIAGYGDIFAHTLPESAKFSTRFSQKVSQGLAQMGFQDPIAHHFITY
jgi:hypothetical protein